MWDESPKPYETPTQDVLRNKLLRAFGLQETVNTTGWSGYSGIKGN